MAGVQVRRPAHASTLDHYPVGSTAVVLLRDFGWSGNADAIATACFGFVESFIGTIDKFFGVNSIYRKLANAYADSYTMLAT